MTEILIIATLLGATLVFATRRRPAPVRVRAGR